jgi:Cu2+-exporting ATPase
MLRAIIPFVRSFFKSNHSSNSKITCYHCGEKSLPKHTVYVQFDGEIRPVCCHGCAAILRTVDDLGMREEYLAHKTQQSRQDEQSKS